MSSSANVGASSPKLQAASSDVKASSPKEGASSPKVTSTSPKVAAPSPRMTPSSPHAAVPRKPAKEKKRTDSPKAPAPVPKPATASREDNLTYDLKHLAAYDIAPLDPKVDFLAYTRDSVQLLMNKIYALPQTKAEEGMLATLPDQEIFRLPRAKPVPKAKPKTRWEKFMEERNMTKRKRSRLVYDEDSGDWKPRWGYKSAKRSQDKTNNWAIEVKEGQDPFENPFEKQAAEKKLLIARQKMREVRNKVEALGGKLRASTPELKGASCKRGNTGRGKDGLKEALKRAQGSTASMGKFDSLAPNEATNLRSRKRKGTCSNDISGSAEKEKYLKTATRLLTGEGGVDQRKAAKLGGKSLGNKGKAKAPMGPKRRSKQGGKKRR